MTFATAPTPAAKHALQTRQLSVGYRSRTGARTILTDLDLRVKPGELVCLLGPNGSGKSTLLRTLAHIQSPLGGTVEIEGVNIDDLSAIDLARRLGVVLTDRVVVSALSTRRVIELGRYPHVGWFGSLSARDRDVVQGAIDAVGAHDLSERDLNTLSDGERQRIMVARALAQEPVVLLLDEPTAFLDVSSRVEIMGLLRHLAHDEQLAIVVSTHDLELALRTADTVWLVMPGGRLVAGVPEDLILSGDVALAFERGRVRFNPSERTFRLPRGEGQHATVIGEGLLGTLAAAVLEREGYDVADSSDAAAVVVEIDAATGAWTVTARRGVTRGTSFAQLAGEVRDVAKSDRQHASGTGTNRVL